MRRIITINSLEEILSKIIDDKNITSLGMGMPLPKEEYDRQLMLVNRVANTE
jgi:hypothetical protein